jgi:putative salt-induced outer membrane protein YdiY
MNKKLSLTLLTSIVISTLATAQELKQNINIGFSSTTGNSETLNLNGKYDAIFSTNGYNNEALKVIFNTSAFTTESNNIKDNEEYKVNLGLEQIIGNGWLGYSSISWLKNNFLNLNHKASIGAGMGKELFKNGQHSIKAKFGVAHNIEQYKNTQKDHDFTSLNEYIEYNNQLNEISNFFLKFESLENFNDFQRDYEMIGTVGLNLDIAENVNIILSQEIHYDNVPPIGTNKNDTKSLATVGYHF